MEALDSPRNAKINRAITNFKELEATICKN